MNKILSQAIRKAVSDYTPNVNHDPKDKRFFPDKFLFCSDNQLIKFRSINVPSCVIEYPEYNYQRKNREEGLKYLKLENLRN